MSDIEIIKLVFGILLSLGTVTLILLSYALFYKYLIQEKRCTEKVTGIVKRYSVYNQNGISLPIVYYTVNGKEYKVVGPDYKIFKIISKSTPFSQNSVEYTEKNQVVTIKRTTNSFGGVYKNPIAQMYPINSEIDVYYDPENPKLAYVLRYCNKKWMFWLMFFSGIMVFAIDILILMM
jgi:hypothetical protein